MLFSSVWFRCFSDSALAFVYVNLCFYVNLHWIDAELRHLWPQLITISPHRNVQKARKMQSLRRAQIRMRPIGKVRRKAVRKTKSPRTRKTQMPRKTPSWMRGKRMRRKRMKTMRARRKMMTPKLN